MRATALILLVLPVAGLLFTGLIVALIVRMARAGADAPLVPGPDQRISLHGRLFRPDRGFSPTVQFDPTTRGRVSLADGHLQWEPMQGPPWAAPIRAITVHRVAGAGTISVDPYVDIEIDGSGPWRLVVSDRTINRFMTNDFKRFREARRAREFAALLVRGGARS